MNRSAEAVPGTDALVSTLVSESMGALVHRVERMSFGHASVTYRVDTDTRTVIVRTNRDPSVYAGTAANIDTLRGLGLPVPTVLHADLACDRYPFAYVMTDAFPGRDLRYELAGLTATQMTALAGQVVGFERTIGALPLGRGYGFVPIGATGPHRTWAETIRADRSDAFASRSWRGSDDPERARLAADVRAGLDGAERRLSTVEPRCFLDDLTIKNVIVSGGELTGVVDFDVVCYGDPMYWLALTQVAVCSDVGAAGEFYAAELSRFWAPSDEERANLALYSAVHGIEFLTWDTDDAERRERLIAAVRTWLSEAA
ncbi:MAG TPA: aminoglycoside phosphotransferase family protein [Micromonosporaceae bacterium]